MDISKRNQAVCLFQAYNEELSRIYEDALENVENESVLSSPEFQLHLKNSVLNGAQPWFSKELEGLEGHTPEVFFDSIHSPEEALEIFDIAATMVDGDLPDLFLMRLGAFGKETSDGLLKKVFLHDWERPQEMNEEDFHESLLIDMAALRVLGMWKSDFAVKPVLDRFLSIKNPAEFVADGVRDFIIAFEEDIVPELLARLDSCSDPGFEGGYEYLLIFLTQIGMAIPSEEIFQMLKKVFRAMKNKVIAVLCLGDYGDRRAVTLLKSYLDRHLYDVDRQFFYEAVSVLKRLGGDISDIRDPFSR